MKKLAGLLAALMLLPGLAGADVPEPYLSAVTLLTEASDWGGEVFHAACPEAGEAWNVTPWTAFLQYDVSAALWAESSGRTWLYLYATGACHDLTQGGLWQVTSACPDRASWQEKPVILFTRMQGSTTQVCLFRPETGETQVLLEAREPLVLVWRDAAYRDDPLPEYDRALLCSAEITRPEAESPVLSYRLTEVAGDVRLVEGAFAAALREPRQAVIVDEEARAAWAAFAEAYLQLNPGHNIRGPESIRERTDLLSCPAYGRLYEVQFNGSVWLWREGAARALAGGAGDSLGSTGIEDAKLLDLNGDGIQELAYVFSSGSGIGWQHAAVYDPVTGERRIIRTVSHNSAADELSLRLEGGVCILEQGGRELARLGP